MEATRKRLAGKTFDEKVAVLARILDEDGYLADFEKRPDGTYLIREHNCAILGVAVRYGLACSSELEFLREAFPDAEINRVAHKVAGAYVLLRSTTSAGTIPESFSRKTAGLKGHPRRPLPASGRDGEWLPTSQVQGLDDADAGSPLQTPGSS